MQLPVESLNNFLNIEHIINNVFDEMIANYIEQLDNQYKIRIVINSKYNTGIWYISAFYHAENSFL